MIQEPVTPRGRALLARFEKAGLDPARDRWAEGLPHYWSVEELVRDMAELDWMLGDFFQWKFGGDGDIGEFLMFLLDALFELRCIETGNWEGANKPTPHSEADEGSAAVNPEIKRDYPDYGGHYQ